MNLWAARTFGVLLGSLPLAIIGFQYGLFPGVLGGVIGGLITGLPVDKYLDEKYRRLLPVDGQ